MAGYIIVSPQSGIAPLIFGVICMVSFVVGVIGNSVAVFHFWRKKKDRPTIIYSCIALNDLLLSILILFPGLSYMQYHSFWSNNLLVCNLWGVLWNITTVMSIFFILLMSISRTKALMLPFSRNTTTPIIVSIITYFGIQISQSFLPFFFENAYKYEAKTFICVWNYDEEIPTGTRQYKLFTLLYSTMQRGLPFIPIMVCSILSIVVLYSSDKKRLLFGVRRSVASKDGNSQEKPVLRELKNRASVTITIFTLAYAALATPYIVYMILTSLIIFKPNQDLLSFDTDHVFQAVALVICVALHAAVSPVICIVRMRDLRSDAEALLRGVSVQRFTRSMKTYMTKHALSSSLGYSDGKQHSPKGAKKCVFMLENKEMFLCKNLDEIVMT